MRGSISVPKSDAIYPADILLKDSVTPPRAVIAHLERVATGEECDEVSFVIAPVAAAGSYVGQTPGKRNVTTILATVAEPVITAGVADTIMLMRCANAFDCQAGRFFLPGIVFERRFHVLTRASNPNRAPITVTPVQLAVRGTIRGAPVMDPRAIRVSPIEMTTLPLVDVYADLNPEKLLPDDYKGAVIIGVSGVPGALPLPISFSVRRGPLLALILIFTGLGLGWLAQFVDNTIRPALAILASLRNVTRDLESEDADLLKAAISRARRAALHLDVKTASTLSTPIPARAQALVLLRTIESVLPGDGSDSDLRKLILKLRQEVRLEADSRLAAGLDDIANRAAALLAGLPAPMAESLTLQATVAGKLVSDARERNRRLAEPSRVRGLLLHLAGSAMSLVILLTIALAGFYFYWAKSTSFGATPFLDYSQLIAWGLGTRVAMAALPTIQAFFSR